MLKILKNKRYFIGSLLTTYLFSLSQFAYAYSQDPNLGQAAGNMLVPLGLAADGFRKLCFVIGGTLIIGAGMQYKNYRNNPSAVRLSTPVVLLLLGIALILLPIISSISQGSQIVDSAINQ
jgi:hypothetical protein